MPLCTIQPRGYYAYQSQFPPIHTTKKNFIDVRSQYGTIERATIRNELRQTNHRTNFFDLRNTPRCSFTFTSHERVFPTIHRVFAISQRTRRKSCIPAAKNGESKLFFLFFFFFFSSGAGFFVLLLPERSDAYSLSREFGK